MANIKEETPKYIWRSDSDSLQGQAQSRIIINLQNDLNSLYGIKHCGSHNARLDANGYNTARDHGKTCVSYLGTHWHSDHSSAESYDDTSENTDYRNGFKGTVNDGHLGNWCNSYVTSDKDNGHFRVAH